jgi:hypothetical protein
MGIPGGETGDLMASNTATAYVSLSRRRIGWSGAIALVLAALACAAGAAAWIIGPDQAAAALPRSSDIISFDERFPLALSEASVDRLALQPLDRSALAAREMKLRDAKERLAEQLGAQNWSPAPVDEATQSAPSDIPLPRSRPVAANLEAQAAPAPAQADNGPRQDNRTLLQKLSNLWPGPIRLASLAPDGGLFRQGPDLASLGYDSFTAIYDISAKAVYLPNGASLEAHSGMGSLKDDPEHVYKPNVGATPPAVYELKPREQLFHGVRALRMTPVDGSTTLGRSGLLAHNYMLGPNGDSNGCVSIRNYELFLKAFDDGKINRLIVVPSLSGTTSASQRSTSQS